MEQSARYRSVPGRVPAAIGLLLAALFLLPGTLLLAQPDDTPTLRPDTVANDTLDVLQPIDTIPSFEPFAPALGSVRADREGRVSDLPKTDLPDLLYFSLHDPLRKKLPAYPLSLGAPGLLQTFSYAGADPGGLAVSFNGRPLNGVEGDAFDPGFYSPEFIERAEILRGAEAAVYGDAVSLIGLNFLQPRFNVAGSYMRLVFAHGGGGTSNADLTFSRNVASRTNLAFGVRRLTATGSFPNQDVSFWGLRGALTWRPAEGLTLSLSELFSDMTRGAGGGLTPTSTVLSGFPDAVNDTLNEADLRHDLTLAAQWYPALPDGSITDSTDLDRLLRLDGAIYYSHAERSLKVGEDVAEIPDVPVFDRDDVLGARAGAFLPLGRLALHGNLVAELTDGKAERMHFGGMAELPLGDALRFFGGGAVTRVRDVTALTFFGEGRAAISDSLDLRLTARVFADNDSSVTPLTGRYTAERSRLLFEAEGSWHDGESRVVAGGYVRSVASNGTGGDYWISGGNLSLRIPIDFLRIEQSGLLTVAPIHDKRFPLLTSRSDLYALIALFNRNLDLRLGASLEYQTRFAASEYDYRQDEWLYPTDSNREKEMFPMLDVYARARIGSAYIKLVLSNVLNVEYYSVYRYPVWGRSFQIGITWALID